MCALDRFASHFARLMRDRRFIMSEKPSPSDLSQAAGVLGGLLRQVRLVWRLLRDGRVPGWVKLLPMAGAIYLLLPIDFLPDWALPGLGELDDLAIALLMLKAFVDLSPPGIVREHLEGLAGRRGPSKPTDDLSSGPYIDGSYRVLDKDKEK